MFDGFSRQFDTADPAIISAGGIATKRGDVVVIIACLALAASVWASSLAMPLSTDRAVAVVKVDGTVLARLALDEPYVSARTVKLPGGQAIIEYGAGKVRVSPQEPGFCPERICIRTGWISKPGQIIVCIPNRMTITIEGTRNGVDSIVR